MKKLNDDEQLALLELLELHKLFFRTLWSVSQIYLCEDTTKTACVSINNDTVQFVFNPTFWNSLSDTFKVFVLCHEQLHLMCDHFKRLKINEGDARNKNIAADVAVNHAIIRLSGFDRTTDLEDWEKYCWVDTVFADQTPDNQTAEFYYAKLRSISIDTSACIVDDHTLSESAVSQVITDAIGESISDYMAEQKESMSDSEYDQLVADIDRIIPSHNQNTVGDTSRTQTHDTKKTTNQCWRKLYSKIKKSVFKEHQQQHWIAPDRRFSLLSSELSLPGHHEITAQDIVHINVYLDTSGSCVKHAQYFLKTALSINEKLFKYHLYGFGTSVYELPNHPPFNLKGFGNESYQAVSDHVDSCKRVDAVLILTDGQSKMVYPADPHKWHWLITPNGTTKYIVPQCHTHNLSKYNWMK